MVIWNRLSLSLILVSQSFSTNFSALEITLLYCQVARPISAVQSIHWSYLCILCILCLRCRVYVYIYVSLNKSVCSRPPLRSFGFLKECDEEIAFTLHIAIYVQGCPQYCRSYTLHSLRPMFHLRSLYRIAYETNLKNTNSVQGLWWC